MAGCRKQQLLRVLLIYHSHSGILFKKVHNFFETIICNKTLASLSHSKSHLYLKSCKHTMKLNAISTTFAVFAGIFTLTDARGLNGGGKNPDLVVYADFIPLPNGIHIRDVQAGYRPMFSDANHKVEIGTWVLDCVIQDLKKEYFSYFADCHLIFAFHGGGISGFPGTKDMITAYGLSSIGEQSLQLYSITGGAGKYIGLSGQVEIDFSAGDNACSLYFDH